MKQFGNDSVVVADTKQPLPDIDCKQYTLDVCDYKNYRNIVEKEKIDYIIHFAAILSSSGEKNPDLALKVNFHGFFHALDVAREFKC